MSKHERQVIAESDDDESDGFLAKLKKNLPKYILWGAIGAVILAAI